MKANYQSQMSTESSHFSVPGKRQDILLPTYLSSFFQWLMCGERDRCFSHTRTHRETQRVRERHSMTVVAWLAGRLEVILVVDRHVSKARSLYIVCEEIKEQSVQHWLFSAEIQVDVGESESNALSRRTVNFVEADDMVGIHARIGRRHEHARLNAVDYLSISVCCSCADIVYSCEQCTTVNQSISQSLGINLWKQTEWNIDQILLLFIRRPT